MNDPDAKQTTKQTPDLETWDTVEIVRRRLANGRRIADADVHELVAEIGRLRKRLHGTGISA